MRGVQEKEFSAYGINVQSIGEIQDLQKEKEIKVLRIMHSEKLVSLRGLEPFIYIRDLNISSCQIERMECLQNLQQLQYLNLSCNKIQVVQGLSGCKELKKLILSHNRISNLGGLQQIQGAEYKLEYLDLRNNRLQNLKDLQIFQGLRSLKELLVSNLSQGKQQSNTCCQNQDQYWLFLSKLSNFDLLEKIDGQSVGEIKRILGGQLKRGVDQVQVDLLDLVERKKENFDFVQNQGQSNELLDLLKGEVKRLGQEKKDLVDKLEENERFWSEKCEQMGEEINFQVQEVKEKVGLIKKLQGEVQILQEKYEESKRVGDHVQNKNEKKEQMVENMQIRISELIRENGEQHRELQIRYDEIQKLLSDEREYQKQMQELKGQLKESERTLQHFHNQALDNANNNLIRNEEIRRKYEGAFEENKKLSSEVYQLKERQNELLEICREWEYKFEKRNDEVQFKMESERRDWKDEIEKREKEIKERYEDEIEKMEKKFQENLDLYENEFKKALIESNEKFKNLRQAYDEKCQSEQDHKQLMKVAVNKANEYEQVTNELQNALLKLKRQVSEIMGEKEVGQAENEHKIRALQSELEIVIEERNRYQNERMEMERKYSNQNELNINEKMELEKLRQKAKYLEEIEYEIEEIQASLNAKNKMLDDKNETIEELQQTIDNYKKNESTIQEDFNRLMKKYEKANGIIEELEEINNQQTNELEQNAKEIQDKKNLISLFEREVNDIKNKQEREIVQLKMEIKDKEQKIIDLLDLLDECKETINQKDSILNEKEERIKFYEKSIIDREKKYDENLKNKEIEIQNIQAQLDETQGNLVIVLQKFEQQKKVARENIQKLQKDFNL